MKNLLIILLISSLFSQSNVKITEAKISYTGNHPFHSWTGISSDLSLELNCIEKNEACDYLFSVQWMSFNSGNDNRDNNMLYYVNAYEFQNIDFTFKNVKNKSFQQNKTEPLVLNGTLSIAGKNNKISIPLNININNIYFDLKSEFTIKLSDYQVERPTLLMIPIKNEIIINISLKGIITS